MIVIPLDFVYPNSIYRFPVANLPTSTPLRSTTDHQAIILYVLCVIMINHLILLLNNVYSAQVLKSFSMSPAQYEEMKAQYKIDNPMWSEKTLVAQQTQTQFSPAFPLTTHLLSLVAIVHNQSMILACSDISHSHHISRRVLPDYEDETEKYVAVFGP